MEILRMIIFIIVTATLWTIWDDEDSWLNKKRFDEKLSDIRFACSILKIEDIDLMDKGTIFHVKVEDKKDLEKISYGSPYSVTNIYINNELVCKLHRLENLFIKQRTLEYTKNRSRIEIDGIISRAYKIAKKEIQQYHKTTHYNDDSKSFYNT